MFCTKLVVNLRGSPPTRSFVRCMSSSNKSQVDQKEVDHFSKLSGQWWDPNGPMRPLFSMNDMRVPFIQDGLTNTKLISVEKSKGPKSLEGIKILDVGCGGGLLSVPLARLGADVTGIDPTPDLIQVAKNYTEKNLPNAKLKFLSSTIQEHVASCGEQYDAVVSSEVVEHVTAKEDFISSCIAAAKPGGSLFITTISQTPAAWLVVILMAEYVLQRLPRGTHEYDKLISSKDLCSMIGKGGADVLTINGMMYNPANNKWYWCPSDSVNYAVHAIKKYR